MINLVFWAQSNLPEFTYQILPTRFYWLYLINLIWSTLFDWLDLIKLIWKLLWYAWFFYWFKTLLNQLCWFNLLWSNWSDHLNFNLLDLTWFAWLYFVNFVWLAWFDWLNYVHLIFSTYCNQFDLINKIGNWLSWATVLPFYR